MTRTVARMQGMSLMEILVAMAIGLIGVIVITQTYLVNESYKRSTTSAGGAQTNGALALYTVERDTRMGGWGLTWSTVYDCPGLRWYYEGQGYSTLAGGTLPSVRPVPVVINDGGAGPDSITVFYGTDAERVIPATLDKAMASSGDALQLDNPFGFETVPGDLALISQGTTCAMLQITGFSGGLLQHDTLPTAPYNPAGGGALPAFATGALVFNLGRPVVNTYAVNNGALQVASLFTAASSTVVPAYTPTPVAIVDGIVDLQAEYGKDTDNNGIVDSYDNVTPATALEWQQVLSVRIAVLARSEHYVKPDAPGASCTATVAAPTWAGGAFPALGDLTDPVNPARCYGYREFETVVPLRNAIWRQG